MLAATDAAMHAKDTNRQKAEQIMEAVGYNVVLRLQIHLLRPMLALHLNADPALTPSRAASAPCVC